MRDKTKNIICIVLPVVSIFIIAFAFRMGPTGFAVYEDKMIYRINGSVSINLHEKIPADSYIGIKIDRYEAKVNIVEFLEKSGEDYKIREGFILGGNTYKVDFDSLGIIDGFEKGRHVIRTEIVYKGTVLHSSEEVVDI